MKSLSNFLFILVAICSFFLQSCEDTCKETVTYTRFDPVYKGYESIRDEAGYEVARDVERPGKIYVYGQYLFINELEKGIHIFDNSNPSNPINLGFFNLPGNVDMAVKNNLLYADSYIDLVTIDISNISNPTVVNRVKEVFPYGYNKLISREGVIIDWIPNEVTETRPCENFNAGLAFESFLLDGSAAFITVNASASAASAPSVTGVGGSMARFTLAGSYLYTVDNTNLRTFDLSTPTAPKNTTNPQIDTRGIETIFHYNGSLFIGSEDGMHIYGLNNPGSPNKLSVFEHIRACDPVVVQGDYAYVTLRGNNGFCWGTNNQLDIINISNLRAPRLHKTYPMNSPFGVGIDGNNLFICEGSQGLKLFDAQDINNITLQEHYTGVNSFDVIPFNNILMMTGEDGILQFDYSQSGSLQLLSTIPVVHP